MKQKVILDCDPGHDDALAILLAAHHPALELLAITTVAGNQSVEKTSLNALKVCSLAQLEHIPVARGMSQPLLRSVHYAADIHGESGLDGPALPKPSFALFPIHAVDLLIDLLLNSAGDIILIPTGPLTNIAVAMRREPAIIPKIRAISLMGGAIGVGNVTPASEFNIWADPEAAAIVFACGRPITMVPLEVTHQALATPDIILRLRSAQKTVTTLAADLLAFFAEAYRTTFGFAAPPVHDPCAVAAVVDPTIVPTQLMHVDVETVGTFTAGRTVCDVYGKSAQPANVSVGLSLDRERFWDVLIDTLLTYN
jgi:inosine-uridine nucleoside N-ribohydrolase